MSTCYQDGQFPYIQYNFISVNIRVTCITQSRYSIVAGATHSTGYLGGIGYLTCPEKHLCQSQICTISWIRGVADKDKIIARQKFVIKDKIKKTKFAYSDRYHLDRASNLAIHNLTLDDAGNYTCIRNYNDNWVVQLDVLGKHGFS